MGSRIAITAAPCPVTNSLKTMVSYENGKFILRGHGDRLRSKGKRARRVILIAATLSLLYFARRESQPEPDFSLLRMARADDVVLSVFYSQYDDGNAGGHLPAGWKRNDQHEGTSLNKEYLGHLRSLDPIPKKVHMFFPDKDYWREERPLPIVRHGILSLKKLNPGWNVTVYDDEMVDDVIRRAADSDLIPREECELLVGTKDDEGNVIHHAAHIVERTDIARLLLMYTEGGFYLDVDRLISKSIEDVIRPETRLCLPTSNDVNFCHDLMCSSRNNMLFLSTIREATNIRLALKRKRGWLKGGALFDLGPELYNEQVIGHVFNGGGVLSKYEKDGVSALRALLRSSDGLIATKKETSCNEGFLVNHTSLPKCYDREALYDLHGMEAWGPQVDALWGNDEKG